MTASVTGRSTGSQTPPAGPEGGATPPPSVPKWRRTARPYLLSVPAVALIVGILYPFVLGIYYTVLNFSIEHQYDAKFIGLANFKRVLSPGGTFFVGNAAKITIEYALAATIIETVLGVGIALLLNRATVIGRTFEKVLILPLMIAPAIAATMWKFMFNADFGVLNHILSLGPFDWLSKDHVLMSAVLVDVWIFTPFVAILVLAGMRSLPREPFEASAVDGAGPLYMFRRLMLPLIWPYILVAVLFRFMDCLKIFDIPQVLTNGGPGTSATTLQISAYKDLIQNGEYSRGTTYMLILWILVFITARILVGVLGQAQRRAAGSET
jgi:multiple sugar transport system permease protein